jgi:hypothetical protein
MKLQRRVRITIVVVSVLVFVSVAVYMGVFFGRELWYNLFHSGTTGLYLYTAKQEWQNGEKLEAINLYYAAFRWALQATVRRQMARPHFQEYENLRQQGRLREALVACERAARIMDIYDSEGALNYHCAELRYQLLTPTPEISLTPTPTVTPEP